MGNLLEHRLGVPTHPIETEEIAFMALTGKE
jgi:hypothetical protein